MIGTGVAIDVTDAGDGVEAAGSKQAIKSNVEIAIEITFCRNHAFIKSRLLFHSRMPPEELEHIVGCLAMNS